MTNTHLTSDLLVEIGCEELPPKLLKRIQESFSVELTKALTLAKLSFKSLDTFITPRRIAVKVMELSTQQPPQLIVKKGPAKNAAFDDQGHPTKASLGFAQSCGVSVEALSLQETEKGVWLIHETITAGQLTEQLLPTILEEILEAMPLNKRMRWGDSSYSFSRPIHWIVLLFGHQPIKAEIMGVKTGNLTYGHRFHHPGPLLITMPSEYEEILEKTGFVIAHFQKRRQLILNQLQAEAPNNILDPELLDEVTGLVEWPVVLRGKFNPTFLEIPKEVLMAAMQVHQKCFPIVDKKNQLLPEFLIISNIKTTDPTHIIAGNEWVMHARLSDAAFYYHADKQIPLKARQHLLSQIRFYQGLGTLWDKSERIAKLSTWIAEKIKANPSETERAALLAKADLSTLMVNEFPELQGTMGYYYALQQQESETVAKAIKEHYYPRFALDYLPATLEGASIALADRVDSLLGLFGIGNRPTGEKDPFALRRQALGILRLLIEKKLDVNLQELLLQAKALYGGMLTNKQAVEDVLEFCFERLRAWSQEKGIAPRIFEAIFAKKLTCPLDVYHRMSAISDFIKLEEAESLIAANKRVKNILTKIEIPIPPNPTVDPILFKEEAEKNLWTELSKKEEAIAPLLHDRNYQGTLKRLAELRDPIDVFFDKVMIMVTEEKLRENRLHLLARISALFSTVADISLL